MPLMFLLCSCGCGIPCQDIWNYSRQLPQNIVVSDVAAGPCEPESSQTLTESSLGATSSVSDATSTATSIVSSTEARPDNEITSTVSLDSSLAAGTSATTTNTENALIEIEFSETTTTLPSTTKETIDSLTTIEISESNTTLPTTTEGTESFTTPTVEASGSTTILSSTTEETTSTSTVLANEQPQIFTGGFATWAYQEGAMGDCGSVGQITDLVIALITPVFVVCIVKGNIPNVLWAYMVLMETQSAKKWE
ncbi:hypothetical protein F25303_4184 [Fusarium sp. NRRL 25303]|nr:hypothetical protein F25303_4184 [Fusarium sp. NRRL 25303]